MKVCERRRQASLQAMIILEGTSGVRNPSSMAGFSHKNGDGKRVALALISCSRMSGFMLM